MWKIKNIERWISLKQCYNEDPTSSLMLLFPAVRSDLSWLANLLKQRVKFSLLGLRFKLNVQCTWRIFLWMLIHVLWNLAAVSMGIKIRILGLYNQGELAAVLHCSVSSRIVECLIFTQKDIEVKNLLISLKELIGYSYSTLKYHYIWIMGFKLLLAFLLMKTIMCFYTWVKVV